jgi:Flp pilus assembly CpaE family ATPase
MTESQIRQTAMPFGGLHVFSATNVPVDEDALPSLLDGLRRSFDHVVVDFGIQRYRHFRRVAHEATDVIIIGHHDRIALLPTGTVSLLRQLELMGVKRASTHIVVNRFSRWRRPRVDTIGRVLGVPVSLALPVGQVHRFATEFSSLDCRMKLA